MAKALFPEIKGLDQHKYAYAVYLAKERPELVLGHVTSTLPEGMRPGYSGDFREFITRHPPRSFTDLSFLLDFYHFNAARLHHRYNPNRLFFSPIGIVNDMLKESRGVLLWHYQLENLLRLFVPDSDKVARLRKGINAQRRSAYDAARGMKLAKTSLADIITERMLFFNTCNPNVRGALALFGYCD
ncbi:MAG: hypothetical protein AB1921_13515 [Thermodesulfobacteriota bacterium]